ncbi:MAG: slipin family protein [Lachnospiraceae bacterium]
MKYIINQNQCGFLMKEGIFIKTLYCGKYRYPKMAGYQVVIEEMEGSVDFHKLPAEVLLQDQTFAGKVLHIRVPEGYIGILWLNGMVQQVLTEPVYLYWNNWNRFEYELLDMREPEMKAEITKSSLAHIPLKYYKKVQIKPGETGILYFNNQMVDELAVGTYFYWTYAKDVECQVVDLKTRSIEINGQEILTADRIGIRVNLLCNYRITQVKRMLETIKNLETQIYACVQLVVREYIGKYRLDEILEQKEEISGFIWARLKEVQDEYCIEFLTAGIKDIILPGEIRDIMNTVLIAERKAQANVITRREEVASTRSLLNTAKLMDENKTLYKLKELECLERICMQVGNINVAGSGALLEQLRELMGGNI